MFKKMASLAIVVALISQSIAITSAEDEDAAKVIRFPTAEISEQKTRQWRENAAQRSQIKGLGHNKVLSLAKSGDYLYIGLLNGVSRLNTKTGDFKNLTFADGLADITNPVMNTDADGVVWIGSSNSITKIDGDNVSNFLNLIRFKDLITYSSYKAPNGELWLSTNKGIYQKTTDGLWQTYRRRMPAQFNGIAVDKDSNIWGFNSALYFLDVSNIPLKSSRIKDWLIYLPFATNRINISALEIDNNNNLWFGTVEGELFRLSIDNKQWKHFPTLVTGAVMTIKKGVGDELWVGTADGLWHYKNDVWIHLDNQNNVPEVPITALLIDGDTTWIGTKNGFYSIKGNSVQHYTTGGKQNMSLALSNEQRAALEAKAKAEQAKKEAEYQAQIQATQDQYKNIFEDLLPKDRQWLYETVIPLMESGIFKKEKNFHPDRHMTLEEFLKIAILGAGHSVTDQPTDFTTYQDVPDNHWSVPYFNKAEQLGVLPRQKRIGFKRPVTRMRALQLLFAFFQVPIDEYYDTTDFDDVGSSQIPLVETALKHNLVKGYSERQDLFSTIGERYRIANRLLTLGSSGKNVEEVQKALKQLGFYDGEITGVYYYPTVDAMADYQKDRGIVSWGDEGFGAFGFKTREAIKAERFATGAKTPIRKFFDPDARVTRAQMAALLSKFIDFKKNQ